MPLLHAQIVGDQAVLPRADFERLVQIAHGQCDIQIESVEEGPSPQELARLAETGGAFEWLAEEEDLYSVKDLRVRYR